MPDHVHMLISITPTNAVSNLIGYIKGKSAIHLGVSTANGSGTSWGSTSGRGGTT
jgi:REP element-mobilizing transposase RayT